MLTLSVLLAAAVVPALAETPPAETPAATEGADLGEALATAKKPKWDPKGKTIAPFGQGDAKRKQEAYNDAIPLLVQSLEAQPGCGKCLVSLSGALTGAKRYEDAVRVGELLNQLYPERKEGWLEISDAWTEADKPREAADATSKVLEIEKADSNLWWRRNKLLLQIGAFSEANGLLDGAEAAGVKKEDVACLRIQLEAGQNQPAKGRELWATCDASENVDLKRYTEGWLALAEGDGELAAKRLTMAGADDFARVMIAFLRIDQGKPELAVNLLQKLEHPGAWADAHLARALGLHGTGKLDEALAELRDNGLGGVPSLTADQVLLKPKGTEWPNEVARRAAILEIGMLNAKQDPAAAGLFDQAKAKWGESEALAAVAPAPPPAPEVAPEPTKKR